MSEAPVCRAALNQANVRWPGRKKKSDGILPSSAHRRQNPESEHDWGNAVDVTHDPSDGVDCRKEALRLVRLARAGKAPWVKEVIWNRRIWTAKRTKEGWRPYNGSNPHDKHMHVTIFPAYRNADVDWWDDADLPSRIPAPPEEDDDMTADDRKWLDARFDSLDARLNGLEQDVVTVLRGPNHPSLTKILTLLDKLADKMGVK